MGTLCFPVAFLGRLNVFCRPAIQRSSRRMRNHPRPSLQRPRLSLSPAIVSWMIYEVAERWRTLQGVRRRRQP